MDIVDAVKYLKGIFLDGKISANRDRTFFSLFCRGYSQNCFENRECSEPGSWKDYDFIVAEVNSLRQVVIKTDRFGKIFRGMNLPWNIFLEQQHQLIDLMLEDFEIVEPSQEIVDNTINELLGLISCPLLIIGPYLLPHDPVMSSLFGEDDNVTVDKINARRNDVRSLLKNSRHKNLFSYFDMSENIANFPQLLLNQYHFTDQGQKIIYDKIKSELLLNIINSEYK